ncbi:cysteine hydrolase family protein [Butyrivibrio sp. NC2007]|uniref:cysteine hydrolase family protein n=1 Tax=Butyrivibrio sp. NC2007 TaxID=1280683 RepID=UPI0003B329B1|nr:cysteine hydrolase family protein [Butyrivibrio sp. NC2007]
MILLVVDVQKGITNDRLYGCESFINNITELINTARSNNTEIIYIQHDDGPGSGFSIGDEAFEIAEQVAPNKDEKVFVKTINSCFGNPDLTEYLKQTGEKELMIIGLQTNFCIDATVKSAFERGYKVIIPKGTNSTFDNDYMDAETTYRYYNEMMWPKRFAECVSMEEAIKLMQKT